MDGERLKLLARAYNYCVNYDKLPDLRDFDEDEIEEFREQNLDGAFDMIEALQDEFAGADEGEIVWAIIHEIEG